MRTLLIGTIILAAACANDGSDRKRKAPEPIPVMGATATIDGLEIRFDSVWHTYEAAPRDQTIIALRVSDPAGWSIYLQWDGDRDPGYIDTLGGLELYVFDPASEIWMSADPMPNTSDADISEWAAGPGYTSGTFAGVVERQGIPALATVEVGAFTAERLR